MRENLTVIAGTTKNVIYKKRKNMIFQENIKKEKKKKKNMDRIYIETRQVLWTMIL